MVLPRMFGVLAAAGAAGGAAVGAAPLEHAARKAPMLPRAAVVTTTPLDSRMNDRRSIGWAILASKYSRTRSLDLSTATAHLLDRAHRSETSIHTPTATSRASGVSRH